MHLLATKKATLLMDSSKPAPLIAMPSLGTVCPVCGKKSYSMGGIHPQCAVQQADAPRQAVLAAQKKEKKVADAAEKLLAPPKGSAPTYNYGHPKNPR
jgi:hypothetical protein